MGYKSAMFKSPSHYWNASRTDFLHSKGSALVELSIDPFNKKLIRIFCQSVDKLVNYKSVEYCPRTTVQQIIEKVIKILRLNNQLDQFVLVETIGRCLLVASDGSTSKKVAISGQPSIYIEQNRRTLMNSDYILTVLNYWKPMGGYSRRFDLCYKEKNSQMTSCDTDTVDGEPYGLYDNNQDSSSILSQKSNPEYENKSTQTDTITTPPVVPRRRMSLRTPKVPHLLTLKGDESDDQNLMHIISSSLNFGSPGSNSSIILKQFNKYPNQNICVFSKVSDSENPVLQNATYIENKCSIPEILVTVNGTEVADKMVLQSGDIISVGDYYSYFFKDLSMNTNQQLEIKHFLKSTRKLNTAKVVNNNSSDISDQHVTSSSISSCSDKNNSGLSGSKVIKIRKKVSIDLHGISLSCFDTALNQVIIHYFDGRMDLTNAVTFGIYLIRFCRESTRCSFSLEKMQNRMKERFVKSLQLAGDRDYYLLGNLKLTAFTFQLWLVYNNENYIETSEENHQWLRFLESFTTDSFEYLSSYICENSQNLSVCFLDEDPLAIPDEDEDIFTLEKLIQFLDETYSIISNIGCDKMSEIFKNVLTSRIIIYITKSVSAQVLSDMKSFNWQKGIQICNQIEKFEEWLYDNDVKNLYDIDGFLKDFSKLISTKASFLKEMSWKKLRKSFSKIPVSVLNYYLSEIVSEYPNNFSLWKPTPDDMKEANRDYTDVLSQYFQSTNLFTLFQPGIILQTDCLPMDKLIASVDFIAHCTVLDTELIAMGENFQWMSLPKPQSLVNFKNSKWIALRQSIGEERDNYCTNDNRTKLSLIPNGNRNFVEASEYSSTSNRSDSLTPSKKIIAKYLQLKGNMKNHSKSMVSLNETENLPTPPRRKKTKGSFTNLTKPNIEIKSYYLPTDSSQVRQSFGNKSCSGRICRSGSNVSDVSPSFAVDIETDNSSFINDVDQSIEDMEKSLKNQTLYNNKSFSPSIENGFEDDDDDDDDDEMSVGLSAAGLSNRLKSHSKSSDALVEIDDKKQVEVILSKSSNESYGITLVDGEQTNLKANGIFIYKIKKNSPAESTKKIKPGDQIIAINNYFVKELTFEECLLLITKSVNSVKLLIEKSDLKTTLSIMSIYQ